MGRILKNATYKGYIGYNKSVTVDFLEHRRITNHDTSQHTLIKGDFPAIISEEDWNRCAEIRESRIQSMPQLGGGTRKFGRNPSNFYGLKSCGAHVGAHSSGFTGERIKGTGKRSTDTNATAIEMGRLCNIWWTMD